MKRLRSISRLFFVFALSWLVGFLTVASHAEMLTPPDQAAKLLFPKATSVNKESVLLTADEKSQVSKRARASVKDSVFTFYRAQADGKDLGFGGIITSMVRTKDQTSMVGIDPEGKILGIEVIAYYEPPEYLPNKKWLELFKGKLPSADLKAGRDLPIVTGATLTTETMAEAARVIRAVWEVKFKGQTQVNSGSHP